MVLQADEWVSFYGSRLPETMTGFGMAGGHAKLSDLKRKQKSCPGQSIPLAVIACGSNRSGKKAPSIL